MNARCGMAGGCSNDALAKVRIFGVGDRHLCQVCLASLTRLGMDFRVLEDAPAPEWRTHRYSNGRVGPMAKALA